jgi:hypothetical protein
MKLQASRPISPKNLQSQTSSPTKNRLALSRLGILHGRLINLKAAKALDLNVPTALLAGADEVIQ